MDLVEYIDGEPLQLAVFKQHVRRMSVAEDALIQQVYIPAARQQAERLTGTAIRGARYQEKWEALAAGDTLLPIGGVTEIRTLTAGGQDRAAAARLVPCGRSVLLRVDEPLEDVVLEVRAGIEIEKFPSVLLWIIQAAAFAFSNRELATEGEEVVQLPERYLASLLDPIQLPPRL